MTMIENDVGHIQGSLPDTDQQKIPHKIRVPNFLRLNPPSCHCPKGRGRTVADGHAGEHRSDDESESTEAHEGEHHDVIDDEAADPVVPTPPKLSREKVHCADGVYAGDISYVFGFTATSMCVACRFHGCKFMVQIHRVPDVQLVRSWLEAGQHATKAVHEHSFNTMAQITPPQRGRGRGRGRGSKP